jgi:hypothetical protein
MENRSTMTLPVKWQYSDFSILKPLPKWLSYLKFILIYEIRVIGEPKLVKDGWKYYIEIKSKKLYWSNIKLKTWKN